MTVDVYDMLNITAVTCTRVSEDALYINSLRQLPSQLVFHAIEACSCLRAVGRVGINDLWHLKSTRCCEHKRKGADRKTGDSQYCCLSGAIDVEILINREVMCVVPIEYQHRVTHEERQKREDDEGKDAEVKETS